MMKRTFIIGMRRVRSFEFGFGLESNHFQLFNERNRSKLERKTFDCISQTSDPELNSTRAKYNPYVLQKVLR